MGGVQAMTFTTDLPAVAVWCLAVNGLIDRVGEMGFGFMDIHSAHDDCFGSRDLVKFGLIRSAQAVATRRRTFREFNRASRPCPHGRHHPFRSQSGSEHDGYAIGANLPKERRHRIRRFDQRHRFHALSVRSAISGQPSAPAPVLACRARTPGKRRRSSVSSPAWSVAGHWSPISRTRLLSRAAK